MMENEYRYEFIMGMAIAALAYDYWEQRGRAFGSPEVVWYRAVNHIEQERIRHALGLG